MEDQELRLELLQLHMLHRDGAVVQAQWQSSAEQDYRARFHDLARAHHQMTAKERRFQEQVNATAFVAWGSDADGTTIEHKTQILSHTLRETCDLSAPEGSYTRLLRSFEHWYTYARNTRQQRDGSPGSQTVVAAFVESIGDGWKAEAALLRAQLSTFRDDVEGLGDAMPLSDLARCLVALWTQITNMLEELDVIGAIEGDMIHQEAVWMQDAVARLAVDVRHGMGACV